MNDFRAMVDVLKVISGFFQQNSSPKNRDFDLCKRYAALSQFMLKFVKIFYIAAACFYQTPKIYVYLKTGKIIPSMGIYLPMAADFGAPGIVFMHVYNVVVIAITIFLLIALDSLIYLAFLNITMYSALFIRQFEEFKVLVKDPKATLQEIKLEFRNIILMLNRYNE